MDDANVPSLLSIPWMGFASVHDEVYQNTRRMILSRANPYFFQGKVASGIGSPHTPGGYIWPLSLIMQALTSTDADEVERILGWLEASDAGTGLIHEGFHADDPRNFTRPWFAWANSLFAELLIRYATGGLPSQH